MALFRFESVRAFAGSARAFPDVGQAWRPAPEGGLERVRLLSCQGAFFRSLAH